MTLKCDLYETLEVSALARAAVIKAAYRCLVQQYHPDRHGGDLVASDRLARINHAYAVLSDPQKRLMYDRQLGLQVPRGERRGGGSPVGAGRLRSRINRNESRPFGFRPLA